MTFLAGIRIFVKRTFVMEQNDIVRTFGEWKIRVSWQQEEEKWYFSVVDVVGALTEQPTPKRASTYWAVLKNRLKKEGAGELLTTCKQFTGPSF